MNGDRKVAALVGTVGVGVQALLFIEYDNNLLADEPHVLVPIQTYFREWMRRNVYGTGATTTTTTTSRSSATTTAAGATATGPGDEAQR
jgi:hypothetical protein